MRNDLTKTPDRAAEARAWCAEQRRVASGNQAPLPKSVSHIEALLAELEAADLDLNEALNHNDETCESVAERDALIDEVKTLQHDLEAFGEAQKAWVQFRRERDALKAATDRVREALTVALSDWEANRDWHQERYGRKGYSHDEVAVEVYGRAIEAVTEALAALDHPTDTTGETREH